MKGLLVGLLMLLMTATAAAQAPDPVTSRGAVEFDGTDAFVTVACGRDEGDCTGTVALAGAGGQLGSAAYTIAAESSDKVRVPVGGALAGVTEVTVVLGAVNEVRPVERIRTESGVGEGQVEVEPTARERSCRRFLPVFDVRVRGVECAVAKSLIQAVGAKKATRFTVRRFRCTRSGSRYTCSRENLRVRWRRSTR